MHMIGSLTIHQAEIALSAISKENDLLATAALHLGIGPNGLSDWTDRMVAMYHKRTAEGPLSPEEIHGLFVTGFLMGVLGERLDRINSEHPEMEQLVSQTFMALDPAEYMMEYMWDIEDNLRLWGIEITDETTNAEMLDKFLAQCRADGVSEERLAATQELLDAMRSKDPIDPEPEAA